MHANDQLSFLSKMLLMKIMKMKRFTSKTAMMMEEEPGRKGKNSELKLLSNSLEDLKGEMENCENQSRHVT